MVDMVAAKILAALGRGALYVYSGFLTEGWRKHFAYSVPGSPPSFRQALLASPQFPDTLGGHLCLTS